MAEPRPPLRADALRNRARILSAARDLFAQQGHAAQMEDIAAHAQVGVGTLYRHFPTKQALLAAIVSEQFRVLTEVVRIAAASPDGGEAFETMLRQYLEAVEGNTTFQMALLGEARFDWSSLQHDKAELQQLITAVIERAISVGAVRSDLTFDDFVLITRGVLSTMYFRDQIALNWRRHLTLILDGIRTQ